MGAKKTVRKAAEGASKTLKTSKKVKKNKKELSKKPSVSKPVIDKTIKAKDTKPAKEMKEVKLPKKNNQVSLKNRVNEVLNKDKEPQVCPSPPLVKVKSILISQPQPKEAEKNPYILLSEKYNLEPVFCQFIKSVPLTPPEFRCQKIDISEHGAVILTSKIALEFFFKICQENRVTVSEDMKYFCINEQTAFYLQKFINYKKRKVFYGNGSLADLVDVIKKNANEKFLVPVNENHRGEKILEMLDLIGVNYTKGVFYRTVSACVNEKIKNVKDFDILVFFTPAGIKSLKENYPGFKQGETRIAAFGKAAGNAVNEAGLRLDIYAPTPEHPSMVSALEAYIKKVNKR
jgi:uroporphyrinogen-III synthase